MDLDLSFGCPNCTALQKELENRSVEHEKFYSHQQAAFLTLKQKVISTEKLIKAYQSASLECDLQTRNNEDLSRKNEELSRLIDQLRRDLNSRTNEYSLILKEFEPIKQENIKYLVENQELQNECTKLQSEIEAAHVSKQQLEEKVRQLEKTESQLEDYITMSKELKKIKGKLDQLNGQLKEEKDSFKQLRKKFNQNRNSYKKLKTIALRWAKLLAGNDLLNATQKKVFHNLQNTTDGSENEEVDTLYDELEQEADSKLLEHLLDDSVVKHMDSQKSEVFDQSTQTLAECKHATNDLGVQVSIPDFRPATFEASSQTISQTLSVCEIGTQIPSRESLPIDEDNSLIDDVTEEEFQKILADIRQNIIPILPHLSALPPLYFEEHTTPAEFKVEKSKSRFPSLPRCSFDWRGKRLPKEEKLQEYFTAFALSSKNMRVRYRRVGRLASAPLIDRILFTYRGVVNFADAEKISNVRCDIENVDKKKRKLCSDLFGDSSSSETEDYRSENRLCIQKVLRHAVQVSDAEETNICSNPMEKSEKEEPSVIKIDTPAQLTIPPAKRTCRENKESVVKSCRMADNFEVPTKVRKRVVHRQRSAIDSGPQSSFTVAKHPVLKHSSEKKENSSRTSLPINNSQNYSKETNGDLVVLARDDSGTEHLTTRSENENAVFEIQKLSNIAEIRENRDTSEHKLTPISRPHSEISAEGTIGNPFAQRSGAKEFSLAHNSESIQAPETVVEIPLPDAATNPRDGYKERMGGSDTVYTEDVTISSYSSDSSEVERGLLCIDVNKIRRSEQAALEELEPVMEETETTVDPQNLMEAAVIESPLSPCAREAPDAIPIREIPLDRIERCQTAFDIVSSGFALKKPRITPIQKPSARKKSKKDIHMIVNKLLKAEEFSQDQLDLTVQRLTRIDVRENPYVFTRHLISSVAKDWESPLDCSSTPPVPPLTAVQQRCLVLLRTADERMFELEKIVNVICPERFFSEAFLESVCYVMFQEDATFTLEEMCSLSRVYVTICRANGQLNRARTFLYDCLYFHPPKAFALAYTMLLVWGEMLRYVGFPTGQTVMEQTIVYVLTQCSKIKAVPGPGGKVLQLRSFLEKVYGYNIVTEENPLESLIVFLVEKMKAAKTRDEISTVNWSLNLLARWEGEDCVLNVVTEKLWPVLQQWSAGQGEDHTAAAILVCTGLISDKLPANKRETISHIIAILEGMFNRNDTMSPLIQEAAMETLILLNQGKHSDNIIEILKTWRPGFHLSNHLQGVLGTFLRNHEQIADSLESSPVKER